MRNTALKLGCVALLFGVAACSDASSEPGPLTGGAAGTGGSTGGAAGTSGAAGIGGSKGGAAGTGGATGSGGAGGSTAACADEIKACDPFYKSTQAKCFDARQICYAKSDGSTICACQSATPAPQNAPCFSGPGDCQQGFVCVSDTCKTLCDPAAATTTCEGALPCKKLGTSIYGNCDS
jgi:hypothetical protein